MNVPLLLTLLLACPGDGERDRATYLEIVSERSPEVPGDLARCRTLTDPHLAGDCALVVASRAGTRDGAADRHCPEVPAGPWRDECWFQAAEVSRLAGRTDEAITRCDGAGTFRDPCLYHLWQDEITRIHRTTPDLDLAVERGARALERWRGRLGPRWRPVDPSLPLGSAVASSSLEALFWTRFFKQRLEPSLAPDGGICEGQGDLAPWCREGLRDVVVRRALDWRRRGGDCSDLPADPRDAQGWWTERGVIWTGAPDLAADLEVACATRP